MSSCLHVILSASSLEKHFLPSTLTECEKFASKIVVSRGTHLMTGEKEDDHFFQGLQKAFSRNKSIRFITYDTFDDVNGTIKKCNDPVGIHNRARRIAYNELNRWR